MKKFISWLGMTLLTGLCATIASCGAFSSQFGSESDKSEASEQSVVSEREEESVSESLIPEEEVITPEDASKGLEYSLSSDGEYYTVIGYGACTDSVVKIPLTYNGKPVTAIGSSAFTDEHIEEMIVGDSVTKIGDYAFAGCINLKKLTLPQSITRMNDNVVSGRSGTCPLEIAVMPTNTLSILKSDIDTLHTLEITAGELGYNQRLGHLKSLKTVVFHDEITTLSREVLYGSNVENVTLPSSLKEIPQEAFYGCSKLSKINIPDSVETIGDYAFYGCGLESVTIPKSVKIMEECAFSNNKALASVIIDDAAVEIQENAFSQNEKLKEVRLGKSVKNIEYGSFPASIEKVDIGSLENWSSLTFERGTLLSGASELYVDGEQITELTFPETVTSISAYAFYGAPITKLVLPATIQYIGMHAFAECKQLTEIQIDSEWVDENHWSPFYGCTALVKATVPANALLLLPSSVTHLEITKGEIQSQAYRNKSALTDLVLKDGVSSIGSLAFENCAALTNVSFGNGIKRIDDYAFRSCSLLSEITLPSGIEYIGREAFFGTAFYKNTANWANDALYVGEYLVKFSGNDVDSFEIKDGTTLVAANAVNAGGYTDAISELILPASLKYVGVGGLATYSSIVRYNGSLEQWWQTNYDTETLLSNVTAFYIDGELLTGDIVIPDGVTRIPAYTFKNSAVTSVKMPNSVKTIEKGAFYNCVQLAEIEMSTALEKIGASAFYYCNALTEITLPQTLQAVGTSDYQAFHCNSLIKVNYTGTLEQWCALGGSGAVNGAVNGADLYIQGEKLTNLVIPETVSTIQYSAFAGCNSLTSVTFPQAFTQKELGTHFSNCANLKTVTLSDTMETIAQYALRGCTSLESVSGAGVTTVKACAFEACSALQTVDFPLLQTVGAKAFYQCAALKNISLETITDIGKNGFNGCTSLQTIELSSIQKLGDDAFVGATSLTKAVIGESLQTMGEGAFRGCGNLREICLPATLTEIPKNTFSSCGLVEIVIPDTVKLIGENAFSYCDAALQLVIGRGVETINAKAFYSCDNLIEVCNKSSLTINKGSSAHGYAGYYAQNIITDINESAFIWEGDYLLYDSGTDVFLLKYVGTDTQLTLPTSVTKIYKQAFNNKAEIESVSMPSGLTEIGEKAFYHCTALQTVKIPSECRIAARYGAFEECINLSEIDVERFNTIESRAFYHCQALTSATVTASQIGSEAFAYCSKLTSISLGYISLVSEKAFYNVGANRVVIPSSVYYIGAKAFCGVTYICFEQKSGWRYDDNGDSYVVYFTAEELENEYNAATLLNGTYNGAPWSTRYIGP